MSLELVLWNEALSKSINKLVDQVDATGPQGIILESSPKKRRYQCIKHGSTGQSKVLIEVTDDEIVRTNQSEAVWLPLILFTIDSVNATTEVDGTLISNPSGTNGFLTCGLASDAGWRFVRTNILEHTGDAITVIVGF